LIALGSGGIKPLVVSFCGDQFDQRNKHKAKVVFDAFYWIINFGSFFASLFAPLLVLMLVATLVFWLGRGRYVNVPPARRDEHGFLAVVRTALNTAQSGQGRPGRALALAGLAAAGLMLLAWALSATIGFGGWPDSFGFVITACLALGVVIACGGFGASIQLPRARGRHPDAAVDGVRGVLRVLIVFALVTPFWSLFDQKASTWILQGREMVIPDATWWWPGWLIRDAAQMQALNPLLVMLLIPFNNIVLYPLLRRLGFEVTALRRMGWGIAFSGVAWVVAGILQLWIDGGAQVSLAWQSLPYLLLTFGEVLVSATALEFAYSQAPQAMKGVIMAFWYLSSTFGSLWVLLTNAGVRHPNAFLMFFFAVFAFIAALAFALYARSYPMQDHYRVAS